MVGATSGGLGDIVYAIPIMHKLGITKLYVKESYYFPPYGNLYTTVKALLECNGIEAIPTSGAYPPYIFDPTIKFDYNLDNSRRQPKRGSNHIIISYLNEFGLSDDDWRSPWLKVEGEGELHGNYYLIHRTSRWRRFSTVDWVKVLESVPCNPIFIGFEDEYLAFCKETGSNIMYYPTRDILHMAQLIKKCKALYCNQSVSLTIAQGLGKEYYLDRNVPKTNCVMYTPNEHLLL